MGKEGNKNHFSKILNCFERLFFAVLGEFFMVHFTGIYLDHDATEN